MIKNLIFILTLFNFNVLLSQSANTNISIEYDMIVLVGDRFENYSSQLIYNNEQSLFTFKNNSESYSNDSTKESSDKNHKTTEIKIFKKDSTINYLLTNKITNTFQIYNNQKKEVFKDSIPNLKWEILNDTKSVNGINCNRANLNYSGRDYEVWFTYDIPSNFGPWKFHNLPGAIIELRDTKNEVIINAKKISYSNETIDTPNFTELNYKIYTRNDLKLLSSKQNGKLEKRNKQLKKEFISNTPKDIKVNSIEIKTQTNKFIELLD